MYFSVKLPLITSMNVNNHFILLYKNSQKIKFLNIQALSSRWKRLAPYQTYNPGGKDNQTVTKQNQHSTFICLIHYKKYIYIFIMIMIMLNHYCFINVKESSAEQLISLSLVNCYLEEESYKVGTEQISKKITQHFWKSTRRTKTYHHNFKCEFTLCTKKVVNIVCGKNIIIFFKTKVASHIIFNFDF